MGIWLEGNTLVLVLGIGIDCEFLSFLYTGFLLLCLSDAKVILTLRQPIRAHFTLPAIHQSTRPHPDMGLPRSQDSALHGTTYRRLCVPGG